MSYKRDVTYAAKRLVARKLSWQYKGIFEQELRILAYKHDKGFNEVEVDLNKRIGEMV